jgi:hypothetical protein
LYYCCIKGASVRDENITLKRRKKENRQRTGEESPCIDIELI